MKFLNLSIALALLIPAKTFALKTPQMTFVCKSFAEGQIDAYKTLKALNIEIDNYSIGINNIAKISCS